MFMKKILILMLCLSICVLGASCGLINNNSSQESPSNDSEIVTPTINGENELPLVPIN